MSYKKSGKGSSEARSPFQIRHNLETSLIKAGIDVNTNIFFHLLWVSSLISSTIASVFFIVYSISKGLFIFPSSILYVFLIWIGGFIFIFFILWHTLRFILEFQIFRRVQDIEYHLPEYLKLVAANHRAGLPFDKSMWRANKPRFGVLYKEIELVAKHTMTHGDLNEALTLLKNKYPSKVMQRSISSIVQSLKSGTELSPILEEIADNMIKTRNMRSDMASDVQNYLIFIMVAVLFISPFMFGVSYKMIETITTIKASLVGVDTSSMAAFAAITKESSFSLGLMNLFAILMILTNCTISCMMSSLVRHGNIRQELKNIPIFFVVGVVVFLLSKSLLGAFISIS